MRRFFVGILVGLIVLTGMLPVTPHDDFGTGHAHAGVISDQVINNSSDDTSDPPDEQSVVHCSNAAHFFMTVSSSPKFKPLSINRATWSPDSALVTHVTAPATPPPIL